MLLCVSSRESSEVLSAATGEVQVVAGASFKFGDTGAVGVEGLGCGLDTEPCFGASSAQADAVVGTSRVTVVVVHMCKFSAGHDGMRFSGKVQDRSFD